MGFVGLLVVRVAVPFTPAVEIGWRLARGYWGRGYATEAAEVALAHAFGPLGRREVVAFTVPGNAASRRVMEKISMRYDPADNSTIPTCLKITRCAAMCSTAPRGRLSEWTAVRTSASGGDWMACGNRLSGGRASCRCRSIRNATPLKSTVS